MKKSKFTEQQIAFALQRAESGTAVAEVCREDGYLGGDLLSLWTALPMQDDFDLICLARAQTH
jgi:Transposase